MIMRVYLAVLLLNVIFSAYSKEIEWQQLLGLKEDAKTKKSKPSKELKELINKEITIKGFMMPLDYEAKKVSEFLLMPYVPSCMHVPPPPPNQMILVKMKKGSDVAVSYYPVSVTGILKIEDNTNLGASFEVSGIKLGEIKE